MNIKKRALTQPARNSDHWRSPPIRRLQSLKGSSMPRRGGSGTRKFHSSPNACEPGAASFPFARGRNEKLRGKEGGAVLSRRIKSIARMKKFMSGNRKGGTGRIIFQRLRRAKKGGFNSRNGRHPDVDTKAFHKCKRKTHQKTV